MTADDKANEALQRTADRLAGVLSKLAGQASVVRSTGFRIPILDADPDADDPTNLWMLEDGRLRGRTAGGVIKEWAAVGSPGGTTTGTPKPVDPAPQRIYHTYKANWARMFCENHGAEDYPAHVQYGWGGTKHNERKVMLGFDDAQIRTDFAGATIKQVQLRMLNTDSAYSSGVTLRWGAHNQDTAPGSYSATRFDAWRGNWPQSGWGGGAGHWRTIPAWFGNAFRDNQIKGMTINQPNRSRAWWGEMEWGSVEIAITGVG